MFGFGLAFQLLHNGFLLVPVLPVGGGSQVHQGNGLAASGLLFQLGHRLLLGAVVDNAVDHAVVILHGHLCIFQRIVRQEAGNLGKAKAVAVVTGYLAAPLDGNDVLRDIRYEGLEWIKSIGQTVQRDNYDLVYTAPLNPAT